MNSNSSPSRDKFPYIRKKKTIEKPLQKKKADRSSFSKNGLFNFFSKFDMFGVNVTLSYKGKQSYSTVPGIVASVIVLAIIGSFATYEFYQLILGLNPTISQQVLMRNLEIEGSYEPYMNNFTDSSTGFDFAIGLS